MRVFFDTSVLVAAMITTHPEHTRALLCLQRVKAGTDHGVVAAHSVAEVYAILTRLPLQPRMTPALASLLITQNILSICEVVALTATDYATLVGHLMAVGIAGGATYDALILHTAAQANIDQVVTLNARDFRRVYPALADAIREP